MKCQPWLLDEKQWSKIPYKKGWHYLSYYVVVGGESRATQEQADFFDYMFACMMQRETGWN